jgi:GH3 auxin-responsive promoter
MTLRFPSLVNGIWSLTSRANARAFERGLKSVESTQRFILSDILTRNQECGYGKTYGFKGISTAEAYREKVPTVDYADIESWIRRTALGEKALTYEKTLLLEPTSGGQSGSKFIPYTASLRKEFQRGISPWIHSLFRRHPGAKKGLAYWSLSPPLNTKPPFETKIPVGFQSDADYLGPIGRLMESQLFAVPSSVLRESRPEAFLLLTAMHLLAAKDLTFISVWNPSFLSILLARICAEKEILIRNIHDGGYAIRAKEVEKALSKPNDTVWKVVWPRLALISCWRDGWAKTQSDRLAEIFRGVDFQAKGLLATEGFVSLPFHLEDSEIKNVHLQLLAYRCHFFEFADVESGMTRFAWEIEAGKSYSVLITTSGGLYRYRLRDLVRIEGFRLGCPVLRFIAKEESVSDLTGEKLQSEFVQGQVDKILKDLGMENTFYLLAPEPNTSPPRYHFHICLKGREDNAVILETLLEKSLEENFHYSVSRRLGQLGAVRIVPADSEAEARYYFYKSQRSKLGDIKWKPLEAPLPWAEILGTKRL